jgi:hypothetical protein
MKTTGRKMAMTASVADSAAKVISRVPSSEAAHAIFAHLAVSARCSPAP